MASSQTGKIYVIRRTIPFKGVPILIYNLKGEKFIRGNSILRGGLKKKAVTMVICEYVIINAIIRCRFKS